MFFSLRRPLWSVISTGSLSNDTKLLRPIYVVNSVSNHRSLLPVSLWVSWFHCGLTESRWVGDKINGSINERTESLQLQDRWTDALLTSCVTRILSSAETTISLQSEKEFAPSCHGLNHFIAATCILVWHLSSLHHMSRTTLTDCQHLMNRNT